MTASFSVYGVPVIDIDSHYTEPPDLWTSRAPASYRDRMPRVRPNKDGDEHWFVDDDVDFGPLGLTVVKQDGSKEYGAYSLPSFEEMSDAASYPEPRLRMLDELGISQQIIYPNVAGFGSHRFMMLRDAELRNICARIYNDAIIELQQAGEGRLFPQAVTPFWDIDECVREVHRMKDAGITGIVMTDTPEDFRLPHLHEPHWDPLWSTCQELGFPVNFHVGAGHNLWRRMMWKGYSPQRNLAAISVSLFMVQSKTIMNLILSGLLDRYPNLNFVSVESGIGWIPFLLEAMEWQYDETIPTEREGLSLRPKEYFKRQVYASFWFEQWGPLHAIEELGEDNVMFETDFPHPTCLYPETQTRITETFEQMNPRVRRKVLHDTAARVYNLPPLEQGG